MTSKTSETGADLGFPLGHHVAKGLSTVACELGR